MEEYKYGVVEYPAFDKYPEVKGIFVGGCVSRGVGSSFRASAHAHTSDKDTHKGWICIRSPRKLYKKNGEPSMLMIHELAHILTGEGHTDKWREKVRELGGRITARYKKRKRTRRSL